MIISRYPYSGTVSRPTSVDIASDTQGYKALLGIQCDVERNEQKAGDVYQFTHKVWWWNDAKVIYLGNEMTWSQYLAISNKVDIKEGLYFSAVTQGRVVSGEIKLYNPSQMGCMLGIDSNSI